MTAVTPTLSAVDITSLNPRKRKDRRLLAAELEKVTASAPNTDPAELKTFVGALDQFVAEMPALRQFSPHNHSRPAILRSQRYLLCVVFAKTEDLDVARRIFQRVPGDYSFGSPNSIHGSFVQRSAFAAYIKALPDCAPSLQSDAEIIGGARNGSFKTNLVGAFIQSVRDNNGPNALHAWDQLYPLRTRYGYSAQNL